MKRWVVGFVIALLACVPILANRHSSPTLLQDTDTAVMLARIREADAPLKWFAGDWPLENRFYRPVSTLLFEMDDAIHGDNAAGYGLTNALLCVASVLLLFWFVRELIGEALVATISAVLFASWHYNAAFGLASLVPYAAIAAGLLFLLPKRPFVPAIVAAAGLLFVGGELAGVKDLSHKVYDWIPGRTATSMTVFALIALAAYARYERTSAVRDDPPLTSRSLPTATKNTMPRGAPATASTLWALLALIATALALGSYEQAVMLPALLFASAVVLRLGRYRVRWGWQIGFWGILGGYLALRSALLGWDASGYQEQQLRDTTGALISIGDYVLPIAAPLWSFMRALDDPILLMTEQARWLVLMAFGHLGGIAIAIFRWAPILGAYAMSVLAFLPMAWLNPSDFNHYHYLPMAMRAVFVALVAMAAMQAVAIAASPRAIQAPPRPGPAPGSLPRP